ncbi:MAG: hydroxyacylglutathione hydrolase, partial [Myxococcales bacterium]|nr:hydroxyacylglutathione hydrolase [Myxococcales bacterium]
MLTIEILPVLSDNYTYLLHCPETGESAVVDPPDAQAVIRRLDERGWNLSSLLCTHHHVDHVAGVAELATKYGVEIFAWHGDCARIPGDCTPIDEATTIRVGASQGRVLFVPGHTSGHIAFYFADSSALFCGDALFCGGCGRLFEGSADDLYTALNVTLGELPDQTRVYCGHEYTESNLRFALSVEPDNDDLRARVSVARAIRERGEPTIPSTLGLERRT